MLLTKCTPRLRTCTDHPPAQPCPHPFAATEGAATQPGSFLKSNSFCSSPASVAVPGSWASSSGSSPPSVAADDEAPASEEGSVREGSGSMKDRASKEGSIKEAQKSLARLSLAEAERRLSYEL